MRVTSHYGKIWLNESMSLTLDEAEQLAIELLAKVMEVRYEIQQ